MEQTVEYAIRPGKLGLSLITLAGLCICAGLLYPVAAGYVLLLFVPGILISAYQMVVTPTFGVRMARHTWTILDGERDVTVNVDEICHVRIVAFERFARAGVVLKDGEVVMVPVDLKREPIEFIRDVTARGVPIRTL